MGGKRLQTKKTNHRWLWIIPVLFLLGVAAGIAWYFTHPVKEDPVPENPWAGTVLINDGFDELHIVPAEGVEASNIKKEDFTVLDDGTVDYTGHDYTIKQGVDISVYQGQVDWQALTESGIEFAFIRVGFRGSISGNIKPDSNFEQNIKGASKSDILIGIYFFSQALTAEEGREEAEWVIKQLKGYNIDLPVMFDWEPVDGEDSRSKGVSYSEVLTPAALAFCRTLEQAGYDSGIYMNRQQLYHQYDLTKIKDFSFWLADPHNSPNCYYEIAFWQYTFEGNVAGIDGAVDRDIMFIKENNRSTLTEYVPPESEK